MLTLLAFSFLFCLAVAEPGRPQTPPEGVLPKADDGRTLNFDFETGTLQDWTAEGEAFQGQPIMGDTVAPRRGDMKSQHQGKYWIGTYERQGDRPRGKLTSVPFKVTHPWASFLIGGGSHPETCVQLVDTRSNEVFYSMSGLDEENMRRVAVDLQKRIGQEIYIRLVDNHTGHWGHINFDDFRFHSSEPKVPPRPNLALKDDIYKYAGVKPEEAPAIMTVPEGFEVKLFAGEPDVRQPIGFCMDDRGRLWVAEAYCYPIRRKESEANDRILIFEDTDGDGHFDKCTVFMEHLNLVSGIEYGFGGLWVGAAPYLMFIPIDASGDKPAGPPKILLDGWAYQDTHETLNTFTWGPDGWLYGCHGVFTHSNVGKPGAPNSERTRINAGVWRYHPTKHIFEVFAHGTSNPWGLDFNEYGQAFIEACVVPHCFHMIQGGRYFRQAGAHFNPYTYADIDTIADHLHWQGTNQWAGNNKSGSLGGGHAHCGLMCYLGGAWPKEYNGQLFMGNIHGRRLNMDRLTAKGSGYVASHGPDFLLANDAWARFINFRYGPDGNVYLLDWYDQQACHNSSPEIWDRSNGRIYKVSYRGTDRKETDLKKLGGDLSKLNGEKLLALQNHPNQWYARHARRILQEKAWKKEDFSGLRTPWLMNMSEDLKQARIEQRKYWSGSDDPRHVLNELWCFHAINALDEVRLVLLSQNQDAFIRAWSIQLALEKKNATTSFMACMAGLAQSDPSPIVRLYLASGLQRLPLDQRWPIIEALLAHEEDKNDHNLPLMYWYALEPLAEVNAGRALKLALDSKIPLLGFMARRIASIGTSVAMDHLTGLLAQSDDVHIQQTVLQGISEALKGQHNVTKPPTWAAAYAKLRQSPDRYVKNQALSLAAVFGDSAAIVDLTEILNDKNVPSAQRQSALTALVTLKAPQLSATLQQLLKDNDLRTPALRALGVFDDPQTPAAILSLYTNFTPGEKRDAVTALSGRIHYAKALLTAVGEKKIPIADVPADAVRQLRQLNDESLNKQIAEVWGVFRNSPAERLKQIADAKRMLTRRPKDAPDLSLGRALYQKTCAQCHTLFGAGGKVGPDITGSNRTNLDYLLENVFDPSAVIPKDYAATFFLLKDGRSLTGIVKERNAKTLTLVTATETMTLALDDFEAEKPSEVSLMPEDQLKPFSEHEVRSLFAYLQSPVQVPILGTEENAKEFFNGKDLTLWDGEPSLWRVENGEIVGSSPGIKRNEFLKSQMTLQNFRLTLKVKLVPNKENSGVQFRSEVLSNGDVKGYQADIGQGWWGKLYEEHGRELLVKKDQEQYVKVDDWNDYEIIAVGDRIKTILNGHLCVDFTDPPGAKRGIVAFQIHSGGKMEVRFKDLKLEVLK
jgi:putative membrane-bound dehydrogenase-like protein